MNSKSILIIGAGKAQVPLIIAANKEGYHTIVCDLNPGAPGVALADEFCKVSTKDRYGLLEVAKSKEIDGIVANSEYAMCDVAFISSELGLVGNPEGAISILSSKSKFRELQKRIGLYAPDTVDLDSSEQTNNVDMFVVKPDESSGSRGISVFTDETKIGNILRAAEEASRNGKAIIEEYIPLPSHSVIEGEIFLDHGEIIWDGFFQTIRSKSAPMLPMTYVFPLRETEEKIDSVKEVLTRVFQSLGIIHGEYNVELFFTKDRKPFVIEINPRQGGYELPRLVYEHSGIDYYRLLVTTSVGDDSYWDSLGDFKRQNRLLIHHMLFPRRNGYFKGIRISNEISDKVYRCQIDVRTGDEINTVDASSCIGFVDLDFDNVDDQLNTVFHMEELIKVEVV